MNKEKLRSLIDGASGKTPCDLILKNGRVLDVFSGEILSESVAVKDGMIVGLGPAYAGTVEVDLQGAYIVPGLIDAHIHIESTLATPKEFSKAATKHGITTVIMDPHEIGNVLGTEGLTYMLNASENLPVDFQMMLPSCVPATRHETSGAVLSSRDLAPFYDHARVSGLAEVMDLPSVRETSDDMMEKLLDAQNHRKTIDGHGSGLSFMDNNIYRTAGIRTDHECTTLEEASDRLKKGFYIHIREGSVAKNFDALIPLVNKNNHRRFTFCTDDIYVDDLYDHGSIDAMVRKAMENQLDPVDAVRMATLNPAECYGLSRKGAVAPGYEADLVILDNLEAFTIRSVYKNGNLIWDKETLVYDYPDSDVLEPENTIKLPDFTEEHLAIRTATGMLNLIEIQPNSLLTSHLTMNYEKNRNFRPDASEDLAKLFVMERHGRNGSFGKGIVKGFHMQKGAVATTIAHDSHNLVALGMNDEDLILAVKRIEEIGGGIVIAEDGKILAELKLEIAGLMSSAPLEAISADLKKLHAASRLIFQDIRFNPFLTLSFLTLPVIPELKITDQGLYHMSEGRFIGVDEILP
ncbi:adenine deaminase [Proteiniclasticum sp. SCR006]|uniref:Adenine deaminase n=1 Tax=Proteiniclasticum aestuarii TaxID=2817862 RepID=A0A939H9R9_9CLOT|nr:adenine deaminase [Proteiniclasticum aestuarii]MBO1264325.1 adenine deaminase [Proteiniclasticum aestuarii]